MSESLLAWLDAGWLQFIAWASRYAFSLVLSFLALLAYVLLTRLAFPTIEASVDRSNLKVATTQQAYDTVRLIAGLVTLAVLLLIWGIDFGGLLVLSTSLLTLTGVALFASWSLLSNVTAYFVLLVQSSFRRGNYIRVVDADNYVEGYIAEVNVFNTRLITSDRETVLYPNNLLLARVAVINPRERWKPMGKVVPPAAQGPAGGTERPEISGSGTVS